MEESEHALRWLEGLDQAVEKPPIKASLAELDAILVVFEKGVRGTSSVVEYLESRRDSLNRKGMAGRCKCGERLFRFRPISPKGFDGAARSTKPVS